VSVSPLVVGGSGQFYNITITIANSATTAALTIADTLATGITLSGAPTITGGTSTATLSGCPASGSNTTGCQINSGATVGTIIVRVPVNVAASATNGNNTANLSGGGDPACTAATGQACDPTVPVPVTTPAVTAVAKTASPAAGTTVAVGGSGHHLHPHQHRLTNSGHHGSVSTIDRHLRVQVITLSGAIGDQPGRLHLDSHTVWLLQPVAATATGCPINWHTDRQLSACATRRPSNCERDHGPAPPT
jgi:hypothetical protein